METLLISACLLGENCKYNGGNNALSPQTLDALRKRYELIPVCPEQAGGLPTPREPSERQKNGVFTRSGRNVTAEYRRGAETALALMREHRCKTALLKERSPSCGSGQIYDGSFSGTLIPGDGTAAEALKQAGVIVYGESRWRELLEE